MEENEKTFEAYFSGKMRSAQANDFHSALKANPEFKKRYDEFLAIKEATKAIERDNFCQLLDGVDVDESENISSDSSSSATILPLLKRVMGIAAVFVLGFFVYQSASSTNKTQLYAQNFERYIPENSRGRLDKETLSDVYLSKNYDQFIVRSTDIENQSSELKMMLANVYFETNKIDFAINKLEEITDDSSLRDQKYWYLGLANLKIGNTQEAIKHLDHLQSISNFKKSEIEEILSVIRK